MADYVFSRVMTNVPAGWYPDPSGDPDRLRWWDGSGWTKETASADDDVDAHEWPTPARTVHRREVRPPDDVANGPRRRRSPLVLGGVVVVVVLLLGLVGGYVFMDKGGSDASASRVDGGQATESSTASASAQPSAKTSKKKSGSGVEAGTISYATLSGDWSEPGKTLVEELSPSRGQAQLTQKDAPGLDTDWSAQVAVGQLDPDFEYSGPEDLKNNATAFASTVENKYYAPLLTTRKDLEKKSLEVSGRDAYQVTFHLAFENPPEGFAAKGETVYVVVVDNTPQPSGMYVTIPDNKPELREDAEKVISSLEVG